MASIWAGGGVVKFLALPNIPAAAGRHRCCSAPPPSLFKALTTSTSPLPPPPPKPAGKLSSSATSASDSNRNSSANGILKTLSPRQQEQISLYVRALLEWNQRVNLTAVTNEGEVMTRHVEDSLCIIPPLRSAYASYCGGGGSPDSDHLRVIDVGSGPGLPGLIFAIACPNWELTLLESMNKRCLFLEHAIGLTGLSNVQVLRGRAESVGQSLDFREAFDVAVARAVAEMRTLAEYCLPLVRVGGLFVAAKGYDPQEEVRSAENAIRLMGASIIKLCSVESHGPHGLRTAVVCLKDRVTPRKYPRQPGVPSKAPL